MEINQILCFANHCLHLCNKSNIKEIVFSYLLDADAFVTNNVEEWEMLNDARTEFGTELRSCVQKFTR